MLLGPTFVSYNESGKGDTLRFGSTKPNEQDYYGNVKEPNDWADYVTTLLVANVHVYVFADSGSYVPEGESQAPAAQAYASNLNNLREISGKYYFDPRPNVNHHTTTITDKSIKREIYGWINSR